MVQQAGRPAGRSAFGVPPSRLSCRNDVVRTLTPWALRPSGLAPPQLLDTRGARAEGQPRASPAHCSLIGEVLRSGSVPRRRCDWPHARQGQRRAGAISAAGSTPGAAVLRSSYFYFIIINNVFSPIAVQVLDARVARRLALAALDESRRWRQWAPLLAHAMHAHHFKKI